MQKSCNHGHLLGLLMLSTGEDRYQDTENSQDPSVLKDDRSQDAKWSQREDRSAVLGKHLR